VIVRFAVSNVILAVLFALAAGAPVNAQMYPICDSLDVHVAIADQVVIGRIVEIGTTTRDQNGEYQQPVVIAVEQTLKGKPVKRLLFNLTHGLWERGAYFNVPMPIPKEALAHSHRMLFAIVHNQFETGLPSSVSSVDLDFASHEALPVTSDLNILTTAPAVIQAVKEEIRRIPAAPNKVETFEWPQKQEGLKFAGYQDCAVIGTVDERLEKLAHTLLNQPDVNIDFRPKTTYSRAAFLLQHFKSDENIQLLKGLVGGPDDEASQYALRALKSWGADAAAPIAKVDSIELSTLQSPESQQAINSAVVIQVKNTSSSPIEVFRRGSVYAYTFSLLNSSGDLVPELQQFKDSRNAGEYVIASQFLVKLQPNESWSERYVLKDITARFRQDSIAFKYIGVHSITCPVSMKLANARCRLKQV
jgi:hypothetical protein